jgi:hypothetical protein
MTRKYRDPETPEALEAVLRRIQNMTREEWLSELSWRPDGVEETWRMQRVQGSDLPGIVEGAPLEAGADPRPTSDAMVPASPPEVAKR